MPVPNHSQRCAALTKSGVLCKNFAMVGSSYCHVHGSKTQETSASAVTGNGLNSENPPAQYGYTEPPGTRPSPEMELLLQELEDLILVLRARRPHFNADEFTPAGLIHYVNEKVGGRLPPTQAALLEDVERNLAGTSFADFADPEALRGIILLTYYSVQPQLDQVREQILRKVKRLPGISLLAHLAEDREIASWHALADPAMWKEILRQASVSARMRLA